LPPSFFFAFKNMTSFSSLPADVKRYIAGFLLPIAWPQSTKKQIEAYARGYLSFALIDKASQRCFASTLLSLKNELSVLSKYTAYQQNNENLELNHHRIAKENDPDAYPQLLDALFTECKLPYASSTYSTYTHEIENDIKKIVRLVPSSIHCRVGRLRCRYKVPPLLAACVNQKVPLHIIQFLLRHGARPEATLCYWSGFEVTIQRDIATLGFLPERTRAIIDVFDQYRSNDMSRQ